ncbi:hypothetical protein DC31_15280 [Microbacterium sp. CH12i]|uniref:hypothetical protein n=1 Tax=Microbacterium sp. CH12i TaxID=1479651 RepID=UPI000461E413|nr:hypothetical protein [Microbacterium sp. CH12i]KDA05882.1 hypothetical protein DC31_15280 [Microbacterium sp. CH12i]
MSAKRRRRQPSLQAEEAAQRRKQRWEVVRLIVFGTLFVAAGMMICIFGGALLGIVGIIFGVMSVLTGVVIAIGGDSPAGRVLTIVSCLAFAVVGALMIVLSFVDPEPMGRRGPVSGVVIGLLALGFFGLGAVFLISQEVRRRRRRD